MRYPETLLPVALLGIVLILAYGAGEWTGWW